MSGQSYLATNTASSYSAEFLDMSVTGALDEENFLDNVSEGDPFFVIIVAKSSFETPSVNWTENLELSESEKEFQEQKKAFLKIEPLFLAQYNGKYVVSHDGVVLDSDANLYVLTSRFFQAHSDLRVYISHIEPRRTVRIRTPFRRR